MVSRRRAYFEVKKRIARLSEVVQYDKQVTREALDAVEEAIDGIGYVHYAELAGALLVYFSRFQEKQTLIRDLARKWNGYWNARLKEMWETNGYEKASSQFGDKEHLRPWRIFRQYKIVVEVLGQPPPWNIEHYCMNQLEKTALRLGRRLPNEVNNLARTYLRRVLRVRTPRFTNALTAACLFLACEERGIPITINELSYATQADLGCAAIEDDPLGCTTASSISYSLGFVRMALGKKTKLADWRQEKKRRPEFPECRKCEWFIPLVVEGRTAPLGRCNVVGNESYIFPGDRSVWVTCRWSRLRKGVLLNQ